MFARAIIFESKKQLIIQFFFLRVHVRPANCRQDIFTDGNIQNRAQRVEVDGNVRINLVRVFAYAFTLTIDFSLGRAAVDSILFLFSVFAVV